MYYFQNYKLIVFKEYSFILIILCITLLLGSILLGLSFIGVPKISYIEKTSPYESGFEPFDTARIQFLVSFYLVGLLFLIFDLEIAILFPFALIAGYISITAFVIAYLFFIILTLGFVYEMLKHGIEFIGDMTY